MLAQRDVAVTFAERYVGELLGEAAPDLVVDRLRPRVRLDGSAHQRSEFGVGRTSARGADDLERDREETLQCEVVQRGHELLPGEVAGRAEDDHGARIGCSRQAESLSQRVLHTVPDGAFHYVFFCSSVPDRTSPSCESEADRSTAWPPNWFRSAAATFIAYESSWREVKRAKSECASTVAGTS